MLMPSAELPPKQSSISNSHDYAKQKRAMLVWLCIYSGILGPIMVFMPEQETMLDTLVSLPLLVLGIAWCHFDARQRNFRLGRAWTLFLVFLSIIAFPAYISRTRGIRGIKTILKAIILLIFMLGCMIAAGFATLLVLDLIWPSYAGELLQMDG